MWYRVRSRNDSVILPRFEFFGMSFVNERFWLTVRFYNLAVCVSFDLRFSHWRGRFAKMHGNCSERVYLRIRCCGFFLTFNFQLSLKYPKLFRALSVDFSNSSVKILKNFVCMLWLLTFRYIFFIEYYIRWKISRRSISRCSLFMHSK